MEPIWLGLASPSILSSAANVSQAVLQPFSAAMERAAGLLDKPDANGSSDAASNKESHSGSALLNKILAGDAFDLGDGIEIEDLRIRADELGVDLQQRIHDALQGAGISLDEPLQLRVSPVDGQLEVVGDSSQRAIIEAALANDPDLAADFQQLSAMESLIRAADEHSDFAQAYAVDPYQAVKDFSELFDGGDKSDLQATLTDVGLSWA